MQFNCRNVKSSDTGILSRLAILSSVSNEGAFLPFSMTLRVIAKGLDTTMERLLRGL